MLHQRPSQRQVQSAQVCGSGYRIHLVEIERGAPLACAGAARTVERRHGAVDYGLRRCARHDLLAREDGARPAAPRTPVVRLNDLLRPVHQG